MFAHERNVYVPDKGQSPLPDIPDLNISTAGVENQLLSLDPTKACGPDELPPILLGTVAQELAPALTFIINHAPPVLYLCNGNKPQLLVSLRMGQN